MTLSIVLAEHGTVLALPYPYQLAIGWEGRETWWNGGMAYTVIIQGV